MSATPFFLLDGADLDLLKKSWDALAGQYAANDDGIRRVFDVLEQKYTEKRRVYHNLSHINSLLAMSDSINDKITDRKAVEFAIWFHDAVYNTRKTDNEEQSAKLAVRELTELRVPPATTSSVQDMILATKSHSAGTGSQDMKLFLDLDLSILGASPEVYREYSRAIRQEYGWVPGFVYRRKRREILEGFLRRETLYFTEEMANRLESQARRNIEQEIKELIGVGGC